MVSDREPPYGPDDVGGYQCAGADGVLVEPEEPHAVFSRTRHQLRRSCGGTRWANRA
jgi:hypothetical protein